MRTKLAIVIAVTGLAMSGWASSALAHHAFARTNAAGFPILLDIAPSRSRKTREEVVRRIDGSNRPIKIDQQAALHTHTRHVDGTR